MLRLRRPLPCVCARQRADLVQSRLASLRSLAVFLAAALSATRDADNYPSWIFTPSFVTERDAAAFERRGAELQTIRMPWNESTLVYSRRAKLSLADSDAGAWDLEYLDAAARPDRAVSAVASARPLLLPILTAAWLEAAPSAFAPSGVAAADSAPMQTVEAVAQITRLLFSEQGIAVADIRSLRELVLRMDAYFPFGSDAIGRCDMAVRV